MADINSLNTLKFAKLNGSNYRSWSFNMRLYLESIDLFDHANGTAETPAEDADAEVRRKFVSSSKKAWTHICLAIEPEYQIHVRDTTTAKEAWDTLKKQFARESLLQKVRLRQQYYSLRFHPGNNMMEHISQLKSLHDQLKEIGVAMDDKELAMTLLASLPEEFKPLITALDAVGDENLSYDKVKNMLLNDIERSVDAKAQDNAYVSRRWNKKGKSHNMTSTEKSGKVFRGKCHYCKEVGHFARDCPKRDTKGGGNDSNQKEKKGSARCAQKQEDVLTNEEEALVSTDTLNNSGWIIDSGATQHMTCERNRLTEYVAFDKPCIVHLGDNRSILAFGKGTYHIVSDLGDHRQPIALRDVLYLPDLDKNLLSVRAMVKLGATVEFKGNKCEITRNGKLLAVGKIERKLYLLQIAEDQHVYIAQKDSNLELWHYRYGHLGIDNVKELMKGEMADGISCEDSCKERSVCESCVMGKQHRTEYPKEGGKRASDLLELVHSDVCGPMSVNSFGDSRYFVTFIDDCSRYTHVYFIKRKSEVLEKFKEFVNCVTNLTGKPLKVLRTDNGGEYCSSEFKSYLKEKGISHQLTTPYSPAQNGVSERMNRTLVESARCMLSHANLPREFWAEAINTAAYLRNRSPTTSLKGITPYEAFFNQKPDVSHLKVFGCLAFLHIPSENRKKFDEKSRRVIFVGYPVGTKGYKFYDPSSKRFVRGRDVSFVEKQLYKLDDDSSPQPTSFYFPEYNNPSVEVQEKPPEDDEVDQVHDEMDVGENVVPGQPVGATYEENFLRETENLDEKRRRRPPQRFDEEFNIAENLTADIDEPLNIEEAWSGKHSVEWKEATNAEYDSLMQNETWELVPPPKGKNIVGSRWVFKVKHNSDGNIERFKARLVAQGYSQSHGLDYQEIFSPVVRNTSIRSLLAVANICNWEVHQMDAKTAFLQGDLQDEIYMRQPDGYVDKERSEYVCKLKKGIYGLKQAARCWNTSVDTFLTSNGYKKSGSDPCIYTKSVKCKNGKINFVILALYVDDMLCFSNDIEMLKNEKAAIARRFEVEDLGEVSCILGMRVKRNRKSRTLLINQPKYLEGILKRFGMENCKPMSTPMEVGKKFESLPEDETPVDVQRYQMAIGCLMYAATATRPDISSAVGILSRFNSRPGEKHWQGVKRILRYLKGTLNHGLLFTANGSNPVLSGYSDADWGGDADTRRSTSGYVFQIQNNTVSWSSKRQNSVSKSTTEAEYIALSMACQEMIWLRRLFTDIGFKPDEPSTIYEDNQGAIELSRNPKLHNRTKHIDISYHFIREQVSRNVVSVKYCPSENMLADIMTKALPKSTFEKFRDMLGVKQL